MVIGTVVIFLKALSPLCHITKSFCLQGLLVWTSTRLILVIISCPIQSGGTHGVSKTTRGGSHTFRNWFKSLSWCPIRTCTSFTPNSVTLTVINPNGTSPSKCRHSLCWYTKRHFRIENFQNTIDGHDMRCIYLSTSLPYYFSNCWMAYATIFITTHVHTWLFPLTIHVL